MVEASLVPLALGMSADFYVVVAKVSGSMTDGAVSAAARLVGLFGLWWRIPWLARTR